MYICIYVYIYIYIYRERERYICVYVCIFFSLHVRIRKIVGKSTTIGDCMYRTSYSLPSEVEDFCKMELKIQKNCSFFVFLLKNTKKLQFFLYFPCLFQDSFKQIQKNYSFFCIFNSVFSKSAFSLVKINVLCMLAKTHIS